MSEKLRRKWKYFVWGAKHHPGNLMYILLVTSFFVIALTNEDMMDGLLLAAFFSAIMGGTYIVTSISIGKLNRHGESEQAEDE